MSEPLRTFVLAFAATEVLSLVSLLVGSRLVHRPALVTLGERAYQRKMDALDRVWPLTLVRPSVERGDRGKVTLILASLIALKSVASLVFGVMMVFWLPLASLVVPSIVARHDPGDPTLLPWTRQVAALQVTSHALAAALGFVVVVRGPLAGGSPLTPLASAPALAPSACLASLAFAWAAGRVEAGGVISRGF